MKGCLAAAQFARSLSRDELEAIGGTRGRGCASRSSRATLHRVVRSVDPEALENMLGRHGRRRLARALAADGKRIRDANRNGHHETVALTPPRPLRAVELRRRRVGGHLLERTDVRGKVITRTTPATLITRRCGADYVFPVKGNTPETFDGIDWETDASGCFKEARPTDASSSARYVPLKGLINYPGRSPASSATASRRERAPAAQRAATTAPVHHHLTARTLTYRQPCATLDTGSVHGNHAINIRPHSRTDSTKLPMLSPNRGYRPHVAGFRLRQARL